MEQSFPFNAFHELHNTFKQMQMRYPTMNKRTLNSGSQFLPALADTLDPTHRSQKKDRLCLSHGWIQASLGMGLRGSSLPRWPGGPMICSFCTWFSMQLHFRISQLTPGSKLSGLLVFSPTNSQHWRERSGTGRTQRQLKRWQTGRPAKAAEVGRLPVNLLWSLSLLSLSDPPYTQLSPMKAPRAHWKGRQSCEHTPADLNGIQS